MPKGSFGGSRSSSSSLSRSKSYSYSSPKSLVPVPTSYSIPSSSVNHNVKVEQPGFFSNVFQGFGLGAGQSLAFNMFRSSPSVTPTSSTAASSTGIIPAEQFPKEYIQCMKEYNNSDSCKQYLEKS